jgi:hypothetical protein
MEHVEDDVEVLRGIGNVVAPEGKIIALLPSGPTLFGSIDRTLGHRRRYSRDALHMLAEKAGMRCASIVSYNRTCSLPWWFTGRVLRRRQFSLLQVKCVDWLTPILRHLETYFPFPPLSLIATFEKTKEHTSRVLQTGTAAVPVETGTSC